VGLPEVNSDTIPHPFSHDKVCYLKRLRRATVKSVFQRQQRQQQQQKQPPQPAMATSGIPKFYTDHGEIHCVTENGRKRFLFINPKSVTHHGQTIAFMKTFTALANYLPEAQLAAGNFIRLRESHPNEDATADDETEVEDDSVGDKEDHKGKEDQEDCDKTWDGEEENQHEGESSSPPWTGKTSTPLARQNSSKSVEIVDENSIFSKILYVYGKDPILRMTLIVSIYEGNPYITLRRFWFTDQDKKTSLPAWLPCFGSYRFSLTDDAHELHRFAKRCLQEEEDERRLNMSKRLQNRAHYHDTAILPEMLKPVKRRKVESDKTQMKPLSEPPAKSKPEDSDPLPEVVKRPIPEIDNEGPSSGEEQQQDTQSLV
jgi:hypothetical protein